MFGRMALPYLGGSPAVWTTCMLFFQVALLLGYVYAHETTRLLGVRRQAALHAFLVLLPLLVLPVGIPTDSEPPPVSIPTGWLLLLLTTSIGLPFFLLSTTAPLIQRWFSASALTEGRNPYVLYAASNAGSLAALLAYPALIEPLLSLRVQRITWSLGYLAAAGLLIVCVLATVRTASRGPVQEDGPDTGPPVPGRRKLRWLGLAAVPSALMLAVTAYVSTDVAAVPLLWIVPLALYLLTFVIVFGNGAPRLVPIARRALPIVLLPLVLFLSGQLQAPVWFQIPAHVLAFFLLALLCHHELARTRPHPAHLTEYYVWLAAGGALGGLFNALVAPRVFVNLGEYPVLIVAACFALADRAAFRDLIARPRLLLRPLAAGVMAGVILWLAPRFELQSRMILPLLGLPAALSLSVSRQAAAFALAIALLLAAGVVSTHRAWGQIVYSARSFFGVYRVVEASDGRTIALYHGTTLHGRQVAGADDPEPLSYYHRESPVGDVFAVVQARGMRSAGVIGLGVGSLAAYARDGERWTFYEIDPAVERIARDDRFFTYLRACGASCRVVIGDGRLSVARSTERHDVLVLDAFSSDAIPVHLLTREAVQTYLSHVADGGLLAFHISNRHFNLEPALGRLAQELGLQAATRVDRPERGREEGYLSSVWLVMSPNEEVLTALARLPGWTPSVVSPHAAWTDDYANVWSALTLKR